MSEGNKGCFIYLVRHVENRINECIRSLTLLNDNYLKTFPTDVILLHEPELTPELQVRLQAASAAPLKFALVDLSTPLGVTKITTAVHHGYLNMCRFFAGRVFHHPALADYTYYCRLDTDSFILSPVTYDIFKYMTDANGVYGFMIDYLQDAHEFSRGLWPFARRFRAHHPEFKTYRPMYAIPQYSLYYTNFEICKLDWFKGPVWTAWATAIDKTGGIYQYRWGDHIIRYIGVRSFLPPDQIKLIPGIHYRHQVIEVNAPTRP